MPRATGLFNIEWLNANSQRSYPLTQHATKKDISDSFELPDAFIVSLYLPVHVGIGVQSDRFFIRSIAVFGAGFNITVGYYVDEDTDPLLVASAVIARSSHTTYNAYALPGINDFADTVGKIVIGDISDLSSLPAGQYVFDYAGGVLDPDCIRPIIKSIASITVVNGGDRSLPMYGDIELTAGTNMRLTTVITEGQSPRIRIDAISGEGLNEECTCDDEASGLPPIKTINGVSPDVNGNITISVNDCLSIEETTNGFRLKDTCAQPCCGCTELEALTREIGKLDEAATSVRDFYQSLRQSVDAMDSAFMNSNIGGSDCVVCS